MLTLRTTMHAMARAMAEATKTPVPHDDDVPPFWLEEHVGAESYYEGVEADYADESYFR